MLERAILSRARDVEPAWARILFAHMIAARRTIPAGDSVRQKWYRNLPIRPWVEGRTSSVVEVLALAGNAAVSDPHHAPGSHPMRMHGGTIEADEPGTRRHDRAACAAT